MLDADVIGEQLEIEQFKYEVYITENICITVRIRTWIRNPKNDVLAARPRPNVNVINRQTTVKVTSCDSERLRKKTLK